MNQLRGLLFLTSLFCTFFMIQSCDQPKRKDSLENESRILPTELEWSNSSSIAIMGCRENLQTPCFTPHLLMKRLAVNRDSVLLLIEYSLTINDTIVYVSEYWDDHELDYNYEVCIVNKNDKECRECFGTKVSSYFLCDEREVRPNLDLRVATNRQNNCSEVLNLSSTKAFLLSKFNLETNTVDVGVYPW